MDDNVRQSQGRDGAQPCQSRRSQALLPAAYGPDLNPIEQFFAKLKHWMRRAAQRSVETVHNAIANVLDAVTPTECRNYVENAGYRST